MKKEFDPSKPYTFKRTGKTIINRAVLAAMTNKQSHQNGTISSNEMKWLLRRADGGFGIITTAAANVSKEGKGWEGEIGIYDDSHIEGLTELTNRIHLTDSLIFAQIFHGGMRSPQRLTGVIPISPSKLECNESISGKSSKATAEDIERIIQDFTNAAIRCYKSGFDGIELHGAHGYLISQFLGTKTNLRKDKWGGDLAGRARFLTCIYTSIKKNVPEDFIIGVRISPEISSIGINLNDTIDLVEKLRDLGLDFIHLSCWDVFSHSKLSSYKHKTLSEIIIENCKNPPTIMSTGNIWSSLDARKVLEQGADLVGVARVAISHPNWAKNLSRPNYNPDPPPFTSKYLRSVDLSDVFIDYMKNWEGFVNDD